MGPVDEKRAELAIAEFLKALGFEPGAYPELERTPSRVAEAFCTDLLSGYAVDIPGLIGQGSAEEETGNPMPSGIVAVTGIAVTTVCPHHLMPALGTAAVAYLPGDRLLGLGTLAALVQALGRRLVLQEQLGESVVQALLDHAGARGAYCKLLMSHSCLRARGTREARAQVCSVARAGELARPESTLDLLLALNSIGQQ